MIASMRVTREFREHGPKIFFLKYRMPEIAPFKVIYSKFNWH